MKEKYLGGYLTNDGNSKEIIKSRIAKGYAVLAQMTAFLNDIPLGKRRVEVGLTLRKAWFLNGCLFNSEVWNGFSTKDTNELEVIDHSIMRLIVGAQSKVPIEMLYIETAEMPVKYVMSVRRILYLQTLLKRHDSEITKKVYEAMKENPLKCDWIELIKEDLKLVGCEQMSDDVIKSMTKIEFKNIIKKRLRVHATNKLESLKQTHKKVKQIKHINTSTPQKYLNKW